MEDLLNKLQNSLKPAFLQDFTPPGHSRHQIKNASSRRMLIHNAPFIFTCNADDHIDILKNHSLIVNNGVIEEIIPASAVASDKFENYYDAGKRGGIVLTPGLINTHAHCHQYLMRSSMQYDEGENIDQAVVAWAAWQKHETDDVHGIAIVGDITEQQKYGITTTLTHGPNFLAAEQAARATAHNIINAVSAVSNSRPDNTPALAETFIKNKADYRSLPAIALHYLYKAPQNILEKVHAIVEKYGILLTFHMAESAYVAQETVVKHGRRETALLAEMGFLNNQTLASHVLHVNDREIEQLAAGRIGLAHLPTSNVIHKSGVFPYWKFEEAGAFPRLSLGTDSVVSKNRLDILTEAYQTRITHLFEHTVKFGSLFKMMTANGARVLHQGQRGRIAVGAQADIAFWKIKDRGFIPYDETNPMTLLGNLITHGGRTVRDLMINGDFVIKDRRHQLVDESKLLAEIQNAHMAVRARVK